MTNFKSLFLVGGLGMIIACGPASRPGDHGGGDDSSTDGGNTTCTPSPEVCGDGIDNDCDGLVDCADIDCSGVGGCPVCGVVDDPEAAPIFLPDGVSSGASCTTDANCAAATPNCIAFADDATSPPSHHECHASYTSSLNFVGFAPNAMLTDPSKLLKVCVNMEHSFLHDLQIELLSPPDSGGVRREIQLNKFVGRTGPKIFLGEPVDDDDSSPGTGVGYDYCFTAAATSDMDDVGGSTSQMFDGGDGDWQQLPAGDYKPNVAFDGLVGAPLDGEWQMRVTDLYHIDNGHLFGWKIAFDADLVTDCSGPIIGKR